MRFSLHLKKKRFKATSPLMVFSSIIPGYLDPPNWHHQQQSSHRQPQQGDGRGQNPQLLPPLPEGGSGAADTIRTPGSMSDRARQAKMPQPETALKCPRCESTNTKFCYFNNYSLTQPRHFCKTCRRYWTRGGALRSVPVGGGCRRNKRSKRSKSPASASASDHNQQHGVAGNNNSSSSTVSNSNSSSTNNIDNLTGGHLALPPLPHHQLPFFPALHHLSDYGSSGAGDLNFGSINIQPAGYEFHNQASNGIGQWRSSLQQHQMQQSIPYLANLEAPTNHGLYAFEGNHQNNGHIHSKPLESSIGAAQTASVKMEESQALNVSRNFLGSLGNDQHQQYWPGNNSSITTNGGIVNAWTDLSGFTSSTSHLL